MSGLMNKVKEALHGDKEQDTSRHNTTSTGDETRRKLLPPPQSDVQSN